MVPAGWSGSDLFWILESCIAMLKDLCVNLCVYSVYYNYVLKYLNLCEIPKYD